MCVERIAAGRPDDMADFLRRNAMPREQMDARALGPRPHAGIRQEHDRRLQALGAMHRHDADLVALLLHVALDLDVGRAHGVDEALQRRRGFPVEAERKVEELIERLGGFRSKSA